MRRLYIPIFFGIFILVVFGFFWWNSNSQAATKTEDLQNFLVTRGTSATQIGNKLKEQGLIKSPLAFKIYVQVLGKADQINAGEFKLSSNWTLAEIVEALGGGPLELWVTVPEGLRREEIVEKFISNLGKTPEDAVVFRQSFLLESSSDEGFLFPDTYLFPPEASASAVVSKLKQTFDNRIDKDLQFGISESEYTLKQIITMASILERETVTDQERPIVAGILYKRLETPGWLLQADATVQYIIGTKNCKGKIDCDWWPILTREDLEINSQYNSYKFDGLPPTPIANPGLSSITAAVFPQESDNWFYIHDSDGNIHYAKTLSEHNQNVRIYLGK